MTQPLTTTEKLILFAGRIYRAVRRRVYNDSRVWTHTLYKQANVIGDDCRLNGPAKGLSKRLCILKDVHINGNFEIHGSGEVTIASHTHIGCNCTILTSNHDWKGGYPRFAQDADIIRKPVYIGKEVWIGRDVIILPGTKICCGAIIQAGSVVSGTVKAGEIYSSNPRNIIGSR